MRSSYLCITCHSKHFPEKHRMYFQELPPDITLHINWEYVTDYQEGYDATHWGIGEIAVYPDRIEYWTELLDFDDTTDGDTAEETLDHVAWWEEIHGWKLYVPPPFFTEKKLKGNNET